MKLYNEIILVEQTASTALRAARYMENRKVAKTHQHLLVFFKLDALSSVGAVGMFGGEHPSHPVGVSRLPVVGGGIGYAFQYLFGGSRARFVLWDFIMDGSLRILAGGCRGGC